MKRSGHTQQHLEAAQLIARGKTENIKRILADIAISIEPGLLAGAQLGERVGRGVAGEADTGAVDDRKIAFQQRNLAFQIIKHGYPPRVLDSMDVAERAWHSAMAMASAASSGRGIFSICRKRRVISMT